MSLFICVLIRSSYEAIFQNTNQGYLQSDWHGELQAASPLLTWYYGEAGKMLWNCDLAGLPSFASFWQDSYGITISVHNEQDTPSSERFNQHFFWGSLSFLQSNEGIEIFTGLLLFHFPSIDGLFTLWVNKGLQIGDNNKKKNHCNYLKKLQDEQVNVRTVSVLSHVGHHGNL